MKYNEYIEKLLEGKLDKFPDELKKQIVDYLVDRHEKYLKLIFEGNEEKEKYISLIKFNSKLLLEDSIENIKFQIQRDVHFEELINVSNDIFEKSRHKKLEDPNYIMSQEEIDRYTEKINTILPQVADYNEERARHLLSDTYVDLSYLSGNDVMSFRTNHIR